MAWLGAALAPITGPRWSCGPAWSAPGSDWGDAADWPIAYDATDPITLGVFVGGVDRTGSCHSLSWGLGQSDPLASSVQPNTCSIALAPTVQGTIAIGDRVVILTEWDVLWVGLVESDLHGEDTTEVTYQVRATDDLARAALDVREGVHWGGEIAGVLSTMLIAAGIGGAVYAADVGEADLPAQMTIRGGGSPFPVTHDGSILAMLSSVAYQTVHAAAWTPAGLRIAGLLLAYEADYRTPLEDLAAFSSKVRRRDVGTVRNRWTITDLGFVGLPRDLIFEDAGSQEDYGIRDHSIDGSEWVEGAIDPSPFIPIEDPSSSTAGPYWEAVMRGADGAVPAFVDPIVLADLEGPVLEAGHGLTRLVPFDQITAGDRALAATTERYRVLRVAHRVDTAEWRVAVEAVAIADVPPPPPPQ